MNNNPEPSAPSFSLERVINELGRQRTMLEEDYSSPNRYGIGQTIYQASTSGASIALSPGMVQEPVGGIYKVVYILQATGSIYESLAQDQHRFWRLAREGKPADALLLRVGAVPELFRLDFRFRRISKVNDDPVLNYKEGDSLPRQIRCESAMPLSDFLQRPADGGGLLEEPCMQWASEMLKLGWRVVILGGPELWSDTQSLTRLKLLLQKARQRSTLNRFGIIVANRVDYHQAQLQDLDVRWLTCL